MVCSRLLNLSLSTLSSKLVDTKAITEALHFIGDVVFENDKTKRILNMVGGVRYLCQCIEREVAKVCTHICRSVVEVVIANVFTLRIHLNFCSYRHLQFNYFIAHLYLPISISRSPVTFLRPTP